MPSQLTAFLLISNFAFTATIKCPGTPVDQDREDLKRNVEICLEAFAPAYGLNYSCQLEEAFYTGNFSGFKNISTKEDPFDDLDVLREVARRMCQFIEFMVEVSFTVFNLIIDDHFVLEGESLNHSISNDKSE
ncbi:unnamed protein product [Cylicocyclus nassatus]|uniref:Uncharacterized protein n=1 Tax=Cylicocyclus nassatus TaxID=53992 RepID=A0AA36GJ18_CYLNA|nr:unnamed protein product [Cylicocyclus nassatus]